MCDDLRPRDNSTLANSLLTVFAVPRCGSSLLSSLLEHHPEINSFWEIFRSDYEGAPLAKAASCLPRVAAAMGRRRIAPGTLLDTLMHEHIAGRRIHTYKLFNAKVGVDGELSVPHLPHHLIDKDIINADRRGLFVILERQNTLATYVSQQLAVQTHQWQTHSTHRSAVTVNASRFKRYARQTREWYHWLRVTLRKAALRGRVLELSYEELVSDLNGALGRLWTFLGVEHYRYDQLLARQPGPLPSGISLSLLKKQGATNLQDQINNTAQLPSRTIQRYLGLHKRQGAPVFKFLGLGCCRSKAGDGLQSWGAEPSLGSLSARSIRVSSESECEALCAQAYRCDAYEVTAVAGSRSTCWHFDAARQPLRTACDRLSGRMLCFVKAAPAVSGNWQQTGSRESRAGASFAARVQHASARGSSLFRGTAWECGAPNVLPAACTSTSQQRHWLSTATPQTLPMQRYLRKVYGYNVEVQAIDTTKLDFYWVNEASNTEHSSPHLQHQTDLKCMNSRPGDCSWALFIQGDVGMHVVHRPGVWDAMGTTSRCRYEQADAPVT